MFHDSSADNLRPIRIGIKDTTAYGPFFDNKTLIERKQNEDLKLQ